MLLLLARLLHACVDRQQARIADAHVDVRGARDACKESCASAAHEAADALHAQDRAVARTGRA